MKKFYSYISILLIVAISYTYVGKTLHELFFHHEGTHCDAKTEKHFHHLEHQHEDLVCTFSFAASNEAKPSIENFFKLFSESRLLNDLTSLITKRLFFDNHPLRGPPAF